MKHRRALGREGRASAAAATGSVVRAFERWPVEFVVAVVDLESSAGVVLRGRLFPVHWLAPRRVCCSTSTALWRASATELGSNWCSMFCS